jgi:hypothetical protein
MSTDTPTRTEAYQAIKEAGEDVALRRRIAAALAERPMTTHELAQAFPEHSKNAIRPRVNELLRMDCVARVDRRTNPSGHKAYVHELTTTGHAYVGGDVDPDPEPPVSEHRKRVVEIAREVARGKADRDVLTLAVQKHDAAKRRADPEWGGGLGGGI